MDGPLQLYFTWGVSTMGVLKITQILQNVVHQKLQIILLTIWVNISAETEKKFKKCKFKNQNWFDKMVQSKIAFLTILILSERNNKTAWCHDLKDSKGLFRAT